jgi:hypothetical protein
MTFVACYDSYMENATIPRAGLIWITNILTREQIPFQVTGGLAAKIYGSPRQLADIDIEIPNEKMDILVPLVDGYIKFGPEHYQDEHWDILLMTLSYHGQNIDISGTRGKVFDKNMQQWIQMDTDLSRAIPREAWGVTVPVVPKEDLIAYKEILARDVDREDVRAIK